MFPGITVHLFSSAHIGHGAIIHGASIGKNCLVGMNAVIMDEVELGEECIVGALSFVSQGTIIPPRSLVAGNPARIIREVSDEMIGWKMKGTQLYQSLPAEMRKDWLSCEPLKAVPPDRPQQETIYKPWQKNK
jgi:carbonic anhydrase/acetyltransferase-like protein (isoleucine patch superfamily)